MRPYTTYDDYPEDIAAALRRADACWYLNDVAKTFTIKSRNKEAPLTEKEIMRIRMFLVLRGFNYEIVVVE